MTAGLLLVAFGGITDRLIPLFAIGAFLTFTMSQTGMVTHWRRELGGKRHGERRRVWLHLCINATGATATGAALAVIIIAKFTDGGWITIVAIPVVIVLLKTIKRYYDGLDERLCDREALQFRKDKPPIVLVAMQGWNRLTDKALTLAMELSPDVLAVHSKGPTPAPTNASCARNGRPRWKSRRTPRAIRIHRSFCFSMRRIGASTPRCCN